MSLSHFLQQPKTQQSISGIIDVALQIMEAVLIKHQGTDTQKIKEEVTKAILPFLRHALGVTDNLIVKKPKVRFFRFYSYNEKSVEVTEANAMEMCKELSDINAELEARIDKITNAGQFVNYAVAFIVAALAATHALADHLSDPDSGWHNAAFDYPSTIVAILGVLISNVITTYATNRVMRVRADVVSNIDKLINNLTYYRLLKSLPSQVQVVEHAPNNDNHGKEEEENQDVRSNTQTTGPMPAPNVVQPIPAPDQVEIPPVNVIPKPTDVLPKPTDVQQPPISSAPTLFVPAERSAEGISVLKPVLTGESMESGNNSVQLK